MRGKDNRQEDYKSKVNFLELLGLIITVALFVYVIVVPNNESSSLNSQISKARAQVSENQKKIESNEMYKRLDAYGRRLSTAGDILKYKDSSPAWYETLSEFRKSLPTNVTVSEVGYTAETGQVTLKITAPEKERLIEAMSSIEDFEAFSKVDFNTVTTEKVSFKADKTQFTGYTTALQATVDPSYIRSKFERAEQMRQAKREAAEQGAEAAAEGSGTGALASDSPPEPETGSGSAEENP